MMKELLRLPCHLAAISVKFNESLCTDYHIVYSKKNLKLKMFLTTILFNYNTYFLKTHNLLSNRSPSN